MLHFFKRAAASVANAATGKLRLWADVDGNWKSKDEFGTVGVLGNGIVSIVRTSGTGGLGSTDTYTITYKDGTTSTFTVVNGVSYSDEAAQDAVAAAFAAGADDGVNISYNDAANSFSFTNTDKGSTAVTAHVAATDPHTQYLNTARGDARYDALGLAAAAQAASQPANATNLTPIAGLAGTTGLVRKTAAATYTLDTSAYLTSNQTVTLSGDITGSGSTTIAGTLATVNSNVGSFGSASSVSTFTVNGKGLLTAAGSTPIAIASTAVSGLATVATSGLFSDLGSKPTTISGYGITDGVTLTGTQTLTNKSIATIQLTGALPATNFPALTGDVTSTAGALATTLATVNSNVGTFANSTVTVNAKGLVTAVAQGNVPSSLVQNTLLTSAGVSVRSGNAISIPANSASVGTTFRCKAQVTNAATVNTNTITLRYGTSNTNADTAVVTLALGAGTAVVGGAVIDVIATVQTTGATLGTIQAAVTVTNNGTTGFTNAVTQSFTTTTPVSINTTTANFLGLYVSPSVANVVTLRSTLQEVVVA